MTREWMFGSRVTDPGMFMPMQIPFSLFGEGARLENHSATRVT